jgi:uncharacterized protein (TIGR02266 family)
MAVDPERAREYPRYEVDAFVDYTGTEVLLNHKVHNISLGGICIQTDSVEDVGTIVDLVINFPDLDSAVSLRGEVVWANREAPRDMGIRFIDLDNERKDTLRKYISTVRRT